MKVQNKAIISPPKDLKLGMELILDTRNPMVGSKLTLKAIKRPKRPFNEFASSSNNEQNALDESMRTFGPYNLILPMKACHRKEP